MLKLSAITFLLATMFVSSVYGKTVTVDENDIAQAIKQEFVDRQKADTTNLELEFFGGQTNFTIDNAEELKILINNLKVDEKIGRFSCEAEIFANRQSVATSQIQGKYFPLTKVWVPAQNIAKGEIVKEEMLKAQTIRQSKLKPFMVTDKEKLIGQEAQRSLKEGKVINEKDVGAKILIHRNDIVLAVYRTEKMQITAKAIAQQDGAKSDRIELQNMKTHKTLTGVVQDASTVIIDK